MQALHSAGLMGSRRFCQTHLCSSLCTPARKHCFSSQIEGTQSSLSDLLLFTSKAKPVGVPNGVPNDVQEVSNYLTAMKHGLDRIREGFPISLRLLREIHERLLYKSQGSNQAAWRVS